MSPVLLLLLLLLLELNSESSATLPEGNTGLNFTVAFLENIAYYHPNQPENQVQITALHDNTEVTMIQHVYGTTKTTMNAGDTEAFQFDARLELSREPISNKTLQIISTEKITVHVISLKKNSIQTAVVIPTDKLGSEYLIPPVPSIRGTTDMVTDGVTERAPFKLVIVNADKDNEVTVEGAATSKDVSLQPNQVAQFYLEEEEGLKTVKANRPVAVFFGHTCAILSNCTCGLLYALLPPAKEEKEEKEEKEKEEEFLVPPALAKGAERETFLLLPEKDKVEAFDPDQPLVKTAGAAVLYRPGLLLPLIPQTDFASCSVVNSIPSTQTSAVIVVHKDHTDGVHVGRLSLGSAEWQQLKGTDYVSTSTQLPPGKTVIWHSSTTMAVYFMGSKAGAPFGNPAPVISKTPDFRGCVLTPEVIKIGAVADGWRESVQYCRDEGLELLSFPTARLQRHIYDRLSQARDDAPQEAWIGMRRSSQAGQWYWLNRAPVSHNNWDEGEPGSVNDGQCVVMSLKSKAGFRWSDMDCCTAAQPVCYRDPVLLPL